MSLRDTNISRLGSERFDVLVIGGGINGAVAAAALAARGVKVALVDRGDFAGATSCNSSNLAWGGIKYLENLELLLVDKLCRSRNELMRSYPSTVQEIRFLTTIQRGFRLPVWFVYLGTLVYWVMGRFATRPPLYFTRAGLAARDGAINTANAAGGFEYSDCYLHDNDARFVFNFIRDAMDHGAVVANYSEVTGARREDGEWQVTARDTVAGGAWTMRATALVNAAGPWVDELNSLVGVKTAYRHVYSKGVHLLVDRVTAGNRVLTFFASDGRLFFVIPMGPRTCIGTTDTQVESPAAEVTDEDRRFILDNANMLLRLERPLTRADIIAERCGVRPLATDRAGTRADWVKLSRKHAIDVDAAHRQLSIFGGKLTDCLNVGEEVVHKLAALGIAVPYPDQRWYGEPPEELRQAFLHQARLMDLDRLTAATASEPLTSRFWRRYGAQAFSLLDQIRSDPAEANLLIGNAEYTRCEIEYAARREMIVKLEDFLRRRSKISLVVRHADLASSDGLLEVCRILFGERAQEKLDEYFRSHPT